MLYVDLHTLSQLFEANEELKGLSYETIRESIVLKASELRNNEKQEFVGLSPILENLHTLMVSVGSPASKFYYQTERKKVKVFKSKDLASLAEERLYLPYRECDLEPADDEGGYHAPPSIFSNRMLYDLSLSPYFDNSLIFDTIHHKVDNTFILITENGGCVAGLCSSQYQGRNIITFLPCNKSGVMTTSCMEILLEQLPNIVGEYELSSWGEKDKVPGGVKEAYDYLK